MGAVGCAGVAADGAVVPVGVGGDGGAHNGVGHPFAGPLAPDRQAEAPAGAAAAAGVAGVCGEHGALRGGVVGGVVCVAAGAVGAAAVGEAGVGVRGVRV